MEESADRLKECDVIFLHAPGMNRLVFLAEGAPLKPLASKVRSVHFGSKKANHSEACLLVPKLTEVKIVLQAPTNHN